MSATQPLPDPCAMNRTQLDQLTELESFKPGVRLELVELFETNAELRLTALRAAALAGNGEALRRAAHALKGVSASIGAVGVSALAAEVEAKGIQDQEGVVRAIEVLADAIASARTALAAWLQEPLP